MIASLTGRVDALDADSAVIEVGGIGLRALASPSTLAGLRLGEHARLETTLVVREDALTLFGFRDADERETFLTVQTVSGVGPRLALAILGVLTPDDLRRAITAEDLAALQRVPGIGKRVASRLVLELAGKLGAPHSDAPAPKAAAPAVDDEVVAALVSLGWPARDAGAAVAAVAEAGEWQAGGSRADLLRSALQHLAALRG